MNITYISTSYRDAEFLKACNNSVLRQQDVTSHHIVMIDGYESKHLFDFIENKKIVQKQQSSRMPSKRASHRASTKQLQSVVRVI